MEPLFLVFGDIEMNLFAPILNQMIFLFAFIVIGFVLARGNFVPENSAAVLSKLESFVFVPALVMGTFIKNCNVDVLDTMWKILVLGGGSVLVCILLAIPLSKLCFKEAYLRKMATYGLAFSNFGFMGNAIVLGVFGEAMFFEYTVFTLPFWAAIYAWGAPVLLIAGASGDERKIPLGERLKSFINPMLIGMVIGLVIGLSGLKLPGAVISVIDVAGDCMSPVAMLLTGMTIGRLDVLALLRKGRLYLTTAVKLLIYPLVFFGIFLLLPKNSFFTDTFFKCAMCVASMPMGLNTIVIPAAYGKDTTDAAGLALVSHVLSILTIPLAFMLLQKFIL